MKYAKPLVRTLVALALACASGAVWAQTASNAAPTVGTSPTPATASQPTDKLVSTFSDFSGSPDNAASLVNGLRTGTAITLSGPTGGSPGGEALTFSAPTRPMGYGNIRIALSLAQTQLASQGITNPTPAQLQGALVGSTDSTATQGILQMRASGMGWGQIANSMGYKLGPVMSGKQTFTTTTTSAAGTAAGTTTRASGGTVVHGKSSITTAGGGSINAGGHGGGQSKSQTVTAAGGGGGSGVSTGLGHGHGVGASAGVVSAAGGKAGAGGQGATHGKGGGKP